MSSTKSIVIVLPNLVTGGAESVMVTIANHFSDYSNVHLIVGERKGELLSSVSNNITIHDLRQSRMSKTIFRLSNLFNKLNPNAIFSTMMYNNAIVSLAYKLSNCTAKLILREATTPSMVLDTSSFFFRAIVKWAYTRADYVVAVSDGVLEDLKLSLNLTSAIMIPNPIISEQLIIKSKEVCDHSFFNSVHPVIVTVGKVIEAKDYITLIRAFIELLKRKEVRLIIVGKRMEYSSYAKGVKELIMENEIGNKVDFVGFNLNPYKFMAKADVFVLSSKREGLPGVLIQALYLNGNVVSTNCKSGPKEILDNGNFGSLVPVEDYVSLAWAINNQLEYPIKEEGRFAHLEQYSVSNSVHRYFSLIN